MATRKRTTRKRSARQTSGVTYDCPFGDFQGARTKVGLIAHARPRHGLNSWADIEAAWATSPSPREGTGIPQAVPQSVPASTSANGGLTDPLAACLAATYPNGIWPVEYEAVATFVRGIIEAVNAHDEFAAE